MEQPEEELPGRGCTPWHNTGPSDRAHSDPHGTQREGSHLADVLPTKHVSWSPVMLQRQRCPSASQPWALCSPFTPPVPFALLPRCSKAPSGSELQWEGLQGAELLGCVVPIPLWCCNGICKGSTSPYKISGFRSKWKKIQTPPKSAARSHPGVLLIPGDQPQVPDPQVCAS